MTKRAIRLGAVCDESRKHGFEWEVRVAKLSSTPNKQDGLGIKLQDNDLGGDFMALVPMRLLLDHAAENDYGLPAYNVNNMEQIQAIMQAAAETNSPVILQASRGAVS